MTDSGKKWLIEQRGKDERSSDYRNDYYDELDERRGARSKRMDMTDSRDYGSHKQMKLTKSDINKWKNHMENTDGTKGEHYDVGSIMLAAEKLNIRFNHFDEREFCLAVNMMYSDYGHIIKRLVPDKEKELLICADFARAFLDDPDGPEPSEKLAIYYHCIASEH